MKMEDLVRHQIKTHAHEMMNHARNIDAACEIAYRHGGSDGAHHKAWVIDQMVRALLGAGYDAWVTAATNDGTEDWDVGVAP